MKLIKQSIYNWRRWSLIPPQCQTIFQTLAQTRDKWGPETVELARSEMTRRLLQSFRRTGAECGWWVALSGFYWLPIWYSGLATYCSCQPASKLQIITPEFLKSHIWRINRACRHNVTNSDEAIEGNVMASGREDGWSGGMPMITRLF